jgi:glutathione reductase (NADPH)
MWYTPIDGACDLFTVAGCMPLTLDLSTCLCTAAMPLPPPLLLPLEQGLTEQQVMQKGLRAEVYTAKFTPLKARLAGRASDEAVMQQGLVKMLVEEGSGKVLGLHMVGEDAPEIIQVGRASGCPSQLVLEATSWRNSHLW